MNRLGEVHPFTKHTRCFAVADMRDVIAAIDAEMKPSTKDESTTLVALLLASYPHARGKLDDREWSMALVKLQEAFVKFPAVIGFAAVDVGGLPAKCNFLPKPFDVTEFCTERQTKLNVARIMAHRHIAEIERREAEEKHDRERPPADEASRARVAAMVAGMNKDLEKVA
ncbi:MAG: hypothetical protein ABJA10_02790 [Aestuariivirga sp.]